MNLFVGCGNLTRDPELRYSEKGVARTNFTIAINERRDAPATFVPCVAWEKLAESVAEYARKGRKVLVQGSLTIEEWDDKQTGTKRSAPRIRCRTVEFLDRQLPRTDEAHEQLPLPSVTDDDLASITF